MNPIHITLELSEGDYTISRLASDATIPGWADGPGFMSISRSPHELSVLCKTDRVPPGIVSEGGWACLRFVGPFAFGATGIVLSVVRPLSEDRIGVFVVSTYDGDHLLVKHTDLMRACALLELAGHRLT